MNKKVVILGAVAAGSKVAAKVKRDKPNYEVVIYTKDENVSYSACGMPYYIGNLINNIDDLIVRTVEEFEENGIQIYLKSECVKVDFQNKKVIIKNLITNKNIEDNYDVLVIATGASPVILNIEGVRSENIFTLRNLADAKNIKEKALASKTVTIVGGGYIGIELLENFRRLGLKVNLIETSNFIMNNFDEKFSELIKEHIEKKEGDNVRFYLNEEIEKFLQIEEMFVGTKCKNAGLIKSDFVVLCTGIKPNTDFLLDTEIEFSIKNTIKVDRKLRTNIQDVYACGDCADKNFLVTQKPVWFALGTTANKEGRVVALNVCNKDDKFLGVTGAVVTKYFDFIMSSVGISEKIARKMGFNTVSSMVVKQDKPSYMPNSKDVYFKLVVDKKSHKILGAQALGSANADKAINIISSAILGDMTIEKLVDIDLSYAPPVSATIDALITAAWNIKDKLSFYK
ncbi:FAD-dependent oxidoreductase [bacterium]|nr:FAD-dependent oxidoreductase [bacterium]